MRALLFVVLLAGCKDKAADPPAKPAPTQPDDPSPAARRAADPKPEAKVEPTPGSGSGSGSGSAAAADDGNKSGMRNSPDALAGERKVFDPQAAADKLKKRAAQLKAKEAAEAKKQQ